MVLEEGHEEQCDQSGCQDNESDVRDHSECGSDKDLFVEQDDRDFDQDDGKIQEELATKQNLWMNMSSGQSKIRGRTLPS